MLFHWKRALSVGRNRYEISPDWSSLKSINRGQDGPSAASLSMTMKDCPTTRTAAFPWGCRGNQAEPAHREKLFRKLAPGLLPGK